MKYINKFGAFVNLFHIEEKNQMKNSNKCILYVTLSTFALMFGSCVSFKSGWGDLSKKSTSENTEALFEEAYKIESTASSAESLLLLIDAFKKVEQADPTNYTALWKIGNYNILMGAAYATNKKDKKNYYVEGIKYCEKSMSLNEKFNTERTKVKDITEDFSKLSINEIDAMGFWYTARFYYYKECLNPLGKLLNIKMIIQNNKMIERIDKLDANWAGGGNYFSRALYYIAVPAKFGGSKENANEEFLKAIEVGPDYLVNRWGRAKYLYELTRNKDGFITDLEWVLSKDPSKSGNPYPWNFYIQEDARKMLANMK